MAQLTASVAAAVRALPARTAAVLLLACGLGCAPRPGQEFERYYPPEAAARRALEAGLASWRDGQPPGAFVSGDPPVVVVDSHRPPGQKLRKYEIGGALPGDGPPRFAVHLTLDEPAEEQKARYLVLGISPLWVYRQEDYDMLAHWDCPATETAAADTRPSSPLPGPTTDRAGDGGHHHHGERPGGPPAP